VVIPAYNARRTLAQALESVLRQTLDDWEAVIVDDGSSDDTAEIAQQFASRCARFHVVRQSNSGISAARNAGMRHLPAEYFAFLDADDLWLPDKLEKQVAAARREDADFVDCAFWTFADGGATEDCPEPLGARGLLSSDDFLLALARGCSIRPSCALLRSSLVKAIGGVDETLRAAEDTDYWMRATAQGGRRFYRMSERLCRYRLLPESHSHNFALGFWSHMEVLPRHLTPARMPATDRVKPFRLWFRNSFTLELDRGRFDQLDPMFEAYRCHDAEGWACQIMAMLRRYLPARAFWWVSRYLTIPLAWHFERWFSR
jgi:glycosyltransferase involved in cell wall biosynthesis